MSRTHALILMSLIAVAGCKKEETSTAAAAEASPKGQLGDQVPGDQASRDFAGNFITLKVTDLEVSDSGAEFIYKSLAFKPDGSWSAQGVVEVADESMSCTESGTWEMDPAEDATSARMTWNIAKTDCAGREAGGSLRVSVNISGDDYDIKFR